MPALAHEAGTAVPGPTDDEKGRGPLGQRPPRRAEIVAAVDQDRGAASPLETPDISVWCKNHKKPINAEPGFSAGAELTRERQKWSQPGVTHYAEVAVLLALV